MSATKGRTPEEIDALISMAERKAAGAKSREIAAEFGLTINQVQDRLSKGKRYQEARAVLAKQPTNIAALGTLRRLNDGYWLQSGLDDYGVTQLTDLVAQKWSRAELLTLEYVKPHHVDEVEAVMREFGLTLHPDRETPLVHELTEERKKQDWAYRDRKFIVDQARVVATTFCEASHVLENNRDDPAFFAVIARALQQIPHIGNPVADDLRRLEADEKGATKRAAELAAAIEEREAANRRLVELAVQSGMATGNVIQFPARLH